MNKWIDATLPLTDAMPVWPGDPQIAVRRIDIDAPPHHIALSELHLSSHSGTHFDAPSHFLPDGATLDSIAPEAAIGPCRVIDVCGARIIEQSHLAAALISRPERLIIKTGAAERLPAGEFPTDYPGLSEEAARGIVASGVGLVGIDAPSVGAFENPGPVHEILLSAGIVIIELLLLTNVPAGRYEMIALPLRIAAADGAPARVLLRPLD